MQFVRYIRATCDNEMRGDIIRKQRYTFPIATVEGGGQLEWNICDLNILVECAPHKILYI